MKRLGVTTSFHTNVPAGTQTSISALLTCTREIKNRCNSEQHVYTGLIIENVNTFNYQRVFN